MFRFTIRDVLWLTAIVAIVLGWWLDHRTLKRWWTLHHAREAAFYKENQELRDQNAKLRGLRIAAEPNP
jgi:hypothetical protein